jgi:hypothetical protein
MSRTAWRIQNAKAKEINELRRSRMAVNQNFSRPLPRSKSMGNMRHGRSVSEHDPRMSPYTINGNPWSAGGYTLEG